MKVLKFILLFVFSILLFYSCNLDDESNYSKNQITDRISQDEITTSLLVDYDNYLIALKEKDVKKIVQLSNAGKTKLNRLHQKYGTKEFASSIELLIKNETNSFNHKLLEGDHDGSSCTRNLDGTTYWGNCSFWQGVSAYFDILLHCGTPGDTEDSIEFYYQCNQDKICNHC